MYKILKRTGTTDFGGKFSITDILIQMPDGRKTTFHIRESLPFSIIIPLLGDGNVVMVKQHRVGAGKMSLEFPMGVVKNKTPMEMAEIELKEETGYAAEKLTKVASFYVMPGWSNQIANVFVAENLTKGNIDPEPFEIVSTVITPLSSLPQLVKKGVIFDASTITALYYYNNIIGNNAANIR